MKNVILGSGPLAWWVMHTLVDRNKEVTLLSRSGTTDKHLPAGVEIKKCDARDEKQVAKLCEDAETIYFCAMPPYTQWPELFPRLVKGFLAGATQTQARLVFGDNLYMYGSTRGAAISETHLHAATGHKGKTRAAVAKQFMEAHERGDNPVAIGRTSDFFGPEVVNAVLGDMFFGAAYSNKTCNLLGDIDLPHTFCYIKDFARGLVTLGTYDLALGQAWHIPSAPSLSTREMLGFIETGLNKKIKVRTAGKALISVLGLFNPMLKEVKEMMYTWQEPYIVDHSKFEKVFGLNVTDHETAVNETVAWFNERYSKPQ